MKIVELLSAGDLEPLTGPDVVAEQLIAAAHLCADWDVWGGPKALRYWSALCDRARAACYAGPTLADWWSRMTTQMSLVPPRTIDDRRLVSTLLACGADTAVLAVIRARADTLVLRVRVANEEAKQRRISGD